MNKKYILILALLAVGIFALGAHLATAGPVEVQIGDNTISFLPLIITSKAADAPPGVLYVFSSIDDTTGDAGGRSLMDQSCFNMDANSHFCNLSEINNAFSTTGVFFSPTFEISWVDNATEENLWFTGNCDGWLTSDPAYDGAFIYDYGYSLGTGGGCHSTLKIACCKWMP